MNPTDIVQAAIWEDGDATYLARIKFNGLAATGFTQASLTSITRTIFDTDSATPTTAIATDILVIASVVFDTLQTDGRWTIDETGYNFRDSMGGSNFTDPNAYRVEYAFLSTGGAKYKARCELDAQELWAS